MKTHDDFHIFMRLYKQYLLQSKNINQKEFLTNNPNHPYEDNKSILVLSSNRATSNNTSLTTGRSAEELVAATPNYNTEQLTSHRQQQTEHG